MRSRFKATSCSDLPVPISKIGSDRPQAADRLPRDAAIHRRLQILHFLFPTGRMEDRLRSANRGRNPGH